MKSSNTPSRRSFLQKAALLAAFPLLSKMDIYAADANFSLALKVLTCNIRVDLPEDAEKGLGWKHRKEACIHVVQQQKADIIGFQEVLKNQFLDLKSSLKDYVAFGFDGPEMDQYKEGYHGIAKNPILFSKKRFELLSAGGYWLSETPLKAASISWGSARARNCSWVRLLDKKTKKEIRLINLHLDHISNEAREKQIQVILDEAAQYQTDFVQIMTGDFNVGMDTKVYQNVIQSGWTDTYSQVHGNVKPEGSTNGFKPLDDPRQAKAKKIDFIFTKGPIKASAAKIIKDTYKQVQPSDHYFVDALLHYT